MKRQTGFTLIELMVTLAIIGVLASIALPSYQNYILKAKLVEAVLLLDRLKQDVVVSFESSGNLPGQVMGAASKQSVDFPDSEMVRDFMYRDTSNKKYTRGWLRVRFENDVIPGCQRNKCGVYTGFIVRNGRLAFYCGHWNSGWSSIPLDLLPQNCREPAVSVSYRK